MYTDAKSMEPEKMQEIIKQLDQKVAQFKRLDETSKRYNDWQIVLGVPQETFENLDELNKQLINRHTMWHALDEWAIKTDEWKKTNFGDIDAPNISKQAENYAKICKRLEGALTANPVQARLKFLVEEFEAAMPIVMALRNPDMQDYHYNEINTIVGQVINFKEDGFTLQSLIDMNVVPYME